MKVKLSGKINGIVGSVKGYGISQKKLNLSEMYADILVSELHRCVENR